MTARSGSRHYFAELPSTQSAAIELAREGSPAGTWVVAGRQTAGLGRLGRQWESPVGGLYLSVLDHAPQREVALVPLAVGSTIAQELERTYGVPTRVRWPNDLLIDDDGSIRKLAGILVDHFLAPWGDALVLGVGINVAGGPELYGPDLASRVTTIEKVIGWRPSLSELEELIVRCSLAVVARLRSPSEVPRVLEEIRSTLFGVGKYARVDGTFLGVIEGIGREGELLLSRGSDHRSVHSGEIAIEDLP